MRKEINANKMCFTRWQCTFIDEKSYRWTRDLLRLKRQLQQHSVAGISHPNGFAIKTKLNDSVALHSFYIERKMLKINVHTMRTHQTAVAVLSDRLFDCKCTTEPKDYTRNVLLECVWRGKICYWCSRSNSIEFFKGRAPNAYCIVSNRVFKRQSRRSISEQTQRKNK